MKTRAQSLTIASVVCAIGGVLALVAMAYGFDYTTVDAIGRLCCYLVIAILFFAIAGGFTETGQWKYTHMLDMNLGIRLLIIFSALFGIINIWVGVLFIVLIEFAVFSIVLTTSSKVWFNSRPHV